MLGQRVKMRHVSKIWGNRPVKVSTYVVTYFMPLNALGASKFGLKRLEL